MIKLLGVLDLLMGASILLSLVGLSEKVVFFFGLLILIKALIFMKSFVSWIDVLSLVVVLIGWQLGAIIASLWFIQKGFFSLFA